MVVVGAGWLGSAIARSAGTEPIPRRRFTPPAIPPRARVVVASGRARIPHREGLAQPLRDELAHLRAVLDAAERAGAERVVVLGSSDVGGSARVIDGRTPHDPLTTYAQVKAALEDECVLRHEAGLPVTSVRLAPVHGAGKPRTELLLRMSRLPVVPLPNGGRHSTAFVLLDDAVRAVEWLLDNPAPAVSSVGAGDTPLRALLDALADAQGRTLRGPPVPVPSYRLGRIVGALPVDALHWFVRLASPRAVPMEPPVTPASLEATARILLNQC